MEFLTNTSVTYDNTIATDNQSRFNYKRYLLRQEADSEDNYAFIKKIYTRSSRPELFYKKVSFEISQNSQGNTYVRVSFLIKLQVEA